MEPKTASPAVLHGGDVMAAARQYGISAEAIKPFGGNVNPLGAPESVKRHIINNIDIISVYPDVEYTALRAAIGEYLGVNPEYIIPASGATEIISLFIKAVAPRRSLIIAPAYSEYERELKLVSSAVSHFPLLEQDGFLLDTDRLIKHMTPDIEMLVICSPNNPTGTAISASELEHILEHCRSIGAYVLVDETYAEFGGHNAAALIAENANLLVVRGTGKFFAMPGIRLGYGVCSDISIRNAVYNRKDLWSVNSLGAAAGEVMFSDHAYIKATKDLIETERERIFGELSSWGNVKVYKSDANFMLLRLLTVTADYVFETLIKEGLMVRNASGFEHLHGEFIRFCFLMPEDNDLLLKRLNRLLT